MEVCEGRRCPIKFSLELEVDFKLIKGHAFQVRLREGFDIKSFLYIYTLDRSSVPYYDLLFDQIRRDNCYSTYLDVAEHLDEVVGAAAEREMIKYILIHELDVRISQPYGAIAVPAKSGVGKSYKVRIFVEQSAPFSPP